MDGQQILELLDRGLQAMLERGTIDLEGRYGLRPTQRQALQAHLEYIRDPTTPHRLSGAFNLFTGSGKTALFIALLTQLHKEAHDIGQTFKTACVFPSHVLLNQTIEELKFFAPHLADHIGVYPHDGNAALEAALIFMPYNSFCTLTADGRIHDHNIDLLISDEAHEGTSDLRRERLLSRFNGNALRAAYTATTHRYGDQSVLDTHHGIIFSKPLHRALQEYRTHRETVPFIETHRILCEIPPRCADTRDKILQMELQIPGLSYSEYLRQRHWIETMVDTYAGRRSDVTGDPLSDNQAAFFIQNTVMADVMTDILNAHPVLQAKARKKGFQSVAVTAHSQMSRLLAEENLGVVKQNEAMVLVGDKMLRAGFNHPPIKVIGDYGRESLLDSIQILGRGSRYWENSEKDGRPDGLVYLQLGFYTGCVDMGRNDEAMQLALDAIPCAYDMIRAGEGFNLRNKPERKILKEGGAVSERTSGHKQKLRQTRLDSLSSALAIPYGLEVVEAHASSDVYYAPELN